MDFKSDILGEARSSAHVALTGFGFQQAISHKLQKEISHVQIYDRCPSQLIPETTKTEPDTPDLLKDTMHRFYIELASSNNYLIVFILVRSSMQVYAYSHSQKSDCEELDL
jgi:hypothetical protein